MKTRYWESENVYIIQRDLQLMIENKELKTVISLVMTSINAIRGERALQSAILIYK